MSLFISPLTSPYLLPLFLLKKKLTFVVESIIDFHSLTFSSLHSAPAPSPGFHCTIVCVHEFTIKFLALSVAEQIL